jgi:hypothetical protein
MPLNMHTVDCQYSQEERIVAELELLGVHYLSRFTPDRAERVRPPAGLLADLVRQPSARVRIAVIAVLLARPDYASSVPDALEQLQPDDQCTLRLFYTAAVLLQEEHAKRLRPWQRWQRLPDLFGANLDLPATGSPRERLIALGQRQRQQSGANVNWVGTYESVVHHLLRSWERQAQWSQ